MVPSSLTDTYGVPEYSGVEEERLTENLVRLVQWCHEGRFSERPLNVDLLCELHRGLFEGVRDHAGHMRSASFGSEILTFGPNRSVHRSAVPQQLADLLRRLESRVAGIQRQSDATNYEEAAIRAAVEGHADVVRIHPFEDGNGRSSRLFMAVVLVRLGLRPIPVEACKQEYNEALNQFFRGSGHLLFSLFVRLASEQL